MEKVNDKDTVQSIFGFVFFVLIFRLLSLCGKGQVYISNGNSREKIIKNRKLKKLIFVV